MDTIQNSQGSNSSNETLELRDYVDLYLSHFLWFIVSILICVSGGVFYLLKTHPQYERSASVLIKEDSKGQSISNDVASAFSKMGMLDARRNVDNEIVNFQSPDLMYEVVKRLHLDVNYSAEGMFHKNILYGDQVPVTVAFESDNQEPVSFVMSPLKEKGVILLSEFKKSGDDLDGKPIQVKVGSKVNTPIGVLSFSATPYAKDSVMTEKIYVSRKNLNATVNAYQKRLTVSLENKNATVVNLQVKDFNIQRAEELLNTLINVYNESWIVDKNKITTATNEFINERLVTIQEELGQVDDNITTFKSSNMIPDLAMSVGMDMQNSSEEEKRIMELNNQLSISRYLSNFIGSSIHQLMPANAGLQESNIQTMINQYNTVQLQRNRLVESSSESNLLVQDMDKELAALRSSILNSIDNYIAGLNMQIKTAQNARSRANARIVSNPQQAGQLLSSERQQKVKEALYLFLLQKREENELSKAFTSYSTRVLTSPEHSGTNLPSSPNSRNILLLSFVIGLMLPVGLLHLRESLNTAVRSRKDLSRLSVPFIGEIPQMNKQKETFLSRLKNKFVRRDNTLNHSNDKPQVIVKAKNRGVLNEAFRVVRTNLEFMLKKDGMGRVIMLTSANPGSGKTFISANLSTAMAIQNKRTIVIDLDLRKKSLGAYFDQPKYGVADYLSGNKDDFRSLIAKGTDDNPVHVLTVGSMPPNPAELLSNGRLKTMLDELRKEYDYIFLDCPPIEIVTDADIIKVLADLTIFVIRVDLFERSMLPDVDNMYKTHKFNSMGLLLNGTKLAGGRYSYKYGYGKRGYGYGYGYGYNQKD